MDYMDKESIDKGIRSYRKALNKVLELCPNVVPTQYDYNNGTVLPIGFRPHSRYNRDTLLSKCNYILARHENLFDFGRPRLITKQHTVWSSCFFTLHTYIKIPFETYGWEHGRIICHGEYDEDGKCLGEEEHIPPKITKWHTPRHITIDILDHTGKSWGLSVWNTNISEILNYMDSCKDTDVKIKYLEAVQKADDDVIKWGEALKEVSQISIPE